MKPEEEKTNSFMKEKHTILVMKQDELRSIYQTLEIQKRPMTGEEAIRVRSLLKDINSLK